MNLEISGIDLSHISGPQEGMTFLHWCGGASTVSTSLKTMIPCRQWSLNIVDAVNVHLVSGRRSDMKGSQITERDYEYITRLFAGEQEELLRKMKQRADQRDLPEIMISSEEAKVLHLLIKIHEPNTCLDVGTLFGYSAAIMARAMGPDGRVHSIEKSEKHYSVARENMDELGLSDRVHLVHGDASEELDQFDERSADLILIDADKESYTTYFQKAIRLIRDGGLILADNALYKGNVSGDLPDSDSHASNVRAIREYNDLTAEHPNVESVILPTGDGLNVARYSA